MCTTNVYDKGVLWYLGLYTPILGQIWVLRLEPPASWYATILNALLTVSVSRLNQKFNDLVSKLVGVYHCSTDKVLIACLKLV